MRILLSYRYTGEDPAILKEIIKNIGSSLECAGHSYYCSFWDEDLFKKQKFTNRQILEFVLKKLDESDVYLAFIKSDDKSEGMLLEAGYALAEKKKFYVAIKKGVNTTFMRELAEKVIEFETLDDLYSELKKLN